MKFSTKRLITGLVVLAAVAASLLVPVGDRATAGYGPDRPKIYDWNVEADRTGATTPTFNSFINTPTYGDERNFTRLAPVVANQKPTDADFSNENVAATAGNEYWVRIFVHNDANQGLNDAAHNFAGLAKNTRVRLAIAEGQANGVDVMGYVSADNANPKIVWDSGTFVNSTQRFAVQYVPGSTQIVNQANTNGLVITNNDIVSANGVQIGYSQMNGDMPGCFEFSAYVYAKVKVTIPQVQVNKTVKAIGATDWLETMAVKPGDKISWKLDVQNLGGADATNVTIRDTLPAGLTLDPGSILFVSSEFPAGKALPDTALGSGGTNLNTFAPNGNGAIFLRTVVGNPPTDACEIVNTAFVKGDNIAESSDTAKVTYDKALCAKPAEPTFSCESAAVEILGNRKIKVTAKASVSSGASVASYIYNFGDGSAPLTTDKTVVEHTYAKDGEYQVKVTVNVKVGDSTKTATSDACTKVIKITTPAPAVLSATTPTPTTLAKTGPGEVFGAFTLASLAGAGFHHLRAARRRF